MPITTAFLLASILSVIVFRRAPFKERLNIFSRGAGNYNIMLMVWIFVMAGAFAQVARAMGAIDATVQLVMGTLPGGWILPGVFIAACLVSMSIGTSVGTIVALTPVATGLADGAGQSVPLFVAAAVGGAFFGDNLSFISDTTIMATRTQGIEMREKFLANVWFAVPAALITLLIYIVAVPMDESVLTTTEGDWLRELTLSLPYFAVIVLALCGVDVMVVLPIGIVLAAAIGMGLGTLSLEKLFEAMAEGISGMADLIMVTLLAGGIVALVRHSLEGKSLKRSGLHLGSRTAQLTIAALVMGIDAVTANNTVAILTVGDVARETGERYGISPRRMASILDTFSCVAQSIIPWGAQLLMAAGLASIAPTAIIPYLYYPAILAVVSVVFIIALPPSFARRSRPQ